MEYIIFAAAIIAAFLVGAYVRKPFAIFKKKEAAAKNEKENIPDEVEKQQEKAIAEFATLMKYTGRRGDGEWK